MPGINVIVPLGGLGTRFQKEGYLTRPKPFVPVLGKPMILWVVENLSLQPEDKLMIIYNPNFMSIGSFMKEVVGDKFPDCQFVELPGPTRGAAETVLIGLKALDESLLKRPTLLADGDTFYTSDIVGAFREVASTHNAVFCFHDTQPKPIYSYINIDSSDNITEVKEKVKISDWANSGCYCFCNGSQLADECSALIEANSKQASQDGVGEFYTSGVIATMIAKKEPFRALKLDVGDMHVLGTPTQVEKFCAQWTSQPTQRFVFDLEGVLIAGIKGDPITRNIEECQRLKAQGHKIIVQSTRSLGQEKETLAFLKKLSVPCDELRLGKPRGEFYIGGPNVVDGVLGDLKKQLGFYPTEVKATRQTRPPKKRAPKFSKVKNVKPDSKGINLVLKVVKVEDDASASEKASIVVAGDDSGVLKLRIISEEHAKLCQPDASIQVQNAKVSMTKGFVHVIIDRWGVLKSCDSPVEFEVKTDNDISAIEYELAKS